MGEPLIPLPQADPLNRKAEACGRRTLLSVDSPDLMRVYVPLPPAPFPPIKNHIPAQPSHTPAIHTVDGQPNQDLVQQGQVLVWDPKAPGVDMTWPLVLSFCIYEMGTVSFRSCPPDL